MKKFLATVLLCVLSVSSVYADIPSYSKVQSASLYLYDANMCGDEVKGKSLVNWRGNCHLADKAVPLDTKHTDLTADFINSNRNILDPDGDGNIDVSGGYHDAGDFVKFGLPQMYTSATLEWAMYEYADSFEKNGDKSHFETVLKFFTDYIKKCTFRDNSGNVIAFCYQVADGATDHDYWGAPEVQTTERPVFFATQAKPATDITALAAATLAADYVNTASQESLDYAKALYRFANDNTNKAVGDDHAPSGDEFYKSGDYKDDLAFASAWLYVATGENTYLNNAREYIKSGIGDVSGWIYDWDDTCLGAIVLIAEKTGDSEYWAAVKETLDNWQKDYNTPQGYACIDNWGSARYNTDAQFLALLYSKYKNDMSYAQWAKSQMDYLLGNNTANICYVTGISENSVKYPHHAAASGLNDADDKSAHKHVLYGALVGGPDTKDKHIDKTSDYQYNEVTLDYNAGLVFASAGLYALYGGESTEITTGTEGTTEANTETTTTVISSSNVWNFTDSSWSDKKTRNTLYEVNGLSVYHNGTSSGINGFKFDKNSKTPATSGYYIKLNANANDKITVYVNSNKSSGYNVALTLSQLQNNATNVIETKSVSAKKTGDYALTFTVPADGTYVIYTDDTSAGTSFMNKVILEKALLKGDVDLNGKINKIDSALILKHTANIKQLTDINSLNNADINDDNIINLLDVILSLKA